MSALKNGSFLLHFRNALLNQLLFFVLLIKGLFVNRASISVQSAGKSMIFSFNSLIVSFSDCNIQ